MSSVTFPDAVLTAAAQRSARPPGSTPSVSTDNEKATSPRQLEDAEPDQRTSAGSTLVHEQNWPTEWRAWTTLAACFFLMFNSWGLVNAYGTFASFYKDVLLPDSDALYFNFFGATECFMVLILSGVVGRLLDAGYYRYLSGAGAFLVTLSFFMLSLSNGKGVRDDGNIGLIWLTHGFLAGLGMTCFFVSSSQIAATWFHRRKSLAIGIVASGASISGLVYPIMLRFLTTSIGFNNAVRGIAGLIGLTALFSFCFATPNPRHIFRKPESWRDTKIWIDVDAFRYKPFCWFTAAIAFLFLGFYPVFFNLEEWAATNEFGYKEGISKTAQDGVEKPLTAGLATYYMLAIMNAMSTFGRIGAAWLSDHYGAIRVHTVVTTVCSLLVLLLWTLCPDFAAAMAFIVFFGIFSGSVIGLPPASMAYILGPAPHRQAKLGQWTGMMYTAAGIPSLIGPIIAGHLISQYKTYLTVQLWSGACLALSAACMAVTWHHKNKEVRLAAETSDADADAGCRSGDERAAYLPGRLGKTASSAASSAFTAATSRTVSSQGSVAPDRSRVEGRAPQNDEDEIKEVKDKDDV